MTKALLIVFVQMWLRWTLPRPRIDQVLYACVKVLLPIACVLLLGAALWQLFVPDTRRTALAGLSTRGVSRLAAGRCDRSALITQAVLALVGAGVWWPRLLCWVAYACDQRGIRQARG